MQHPAARATPPADRPIASAAEDRFERGPFVRALARQLVGGPSGESLVLALYGPWGSGKTSILNLLEEALRVDGHTPVLRFNPWLFSGTEQLIGHFFNDLAAQLAEKDQKRYASIAHALQTYGAMLGPLGGMPVVGHYAAMASKVLKALSGVAQSRARMPSGSVESQRHQLMQALSRLDHRVVVLLDDIDRLRHEEIRDVLRLVRLVADFPNIRYVLAFDRSRVVQALTAAEGDGQAWLEKLVQAAYEVPHIPNPDLTQLLRDSILQALQSAGQTLPGAALDEPLRQLISPLFATAREARRYAHHLPLALELMGQELALTDLIVLEALRAASPDAAEQLPAAFEALTLLAFTTNFDVYHRREGCRLCDALEKLLQASGPHAGTVRNLLISLFPATRQHFEDDHIEDRTREWRRTRRVAHPEVLRFYLEKRLADGAVPTPQVRALAGALGDAGRLGTLLEPLKGKQLEALLDRLSDEEEPLAPAQVETALEVLARFEPRLREEGRDTALRGAFRNLLGRLAPPGSPLESAERVLARPLPPPARQALVAALKDSGALAEADEARLQQKLAASG